MDMVRYSLALASGTFSVTIVVYHVNGCPELAPAAADGALDPAELREEAVEDEAEDPEGELGDDPPMGVPRPLPISEDEPAVAPTEASLASAVEDDADADEADEAVEEATAPWACTILAKCHSAPSVRMDTVLPPAAFASKKRPRNEASAILILMGLLPMLFSR